MKNKKILVIWSLGIFILGCLFSMLCSHLLSNKNQREDITQNEISTSEAEISISMETTEVEISTSIITTEAEISTNILPNEAEAEYQTNYLIMPDTEMETETTSEIFTNTLYRADENKKAIKAYKEFLAGKREIENYFDMAYLDSISTPTGEPDKRYYLSYTFFDCNHDGIQELIFQTHLNCDIISYKDNELYFWVNDFEGYDRGVILLNNGSFLRYGYTGSSNYYEYAMYDVNGNKTFSITFGDETGYNCNTERSYTLYHYQGIYVSKELYDALTKPILDIGEDKIEWIDIYHDYYDGKNHDKAEWEE